MDCRTTSWSKAGQRAFTLPEMVAGLGLSGFLVAVISALSLFSGINFACIVNYAEMNTDSVNAMNAMNYEIRRADTATSYTTNSVTVSNATTGMVTFSYNAGTKQLTKTASNTTTVLLKNCESFKFIPFQRTPLSNSISQYELTSTNDGTAKAFFATWTCSRTVLGNKITTDSTSAGRVVLRVK